MFDGVSAQYHTLNHGKKSLVLDLKDPEGLKIAKELCKTADIVLESNRPGAMDRLGLGYEALREIFTRHPEAAALYKADSTAFPLTSPSQMLSDPAMT